MNKKKIVFLVVFIIFLVVGTIGGFLYYQNTRKLDASNHLENENNLETEVLEESEEKSEVTKEEPLENENNLETKVLEELGEKNEVTKEEPLENEKKLETKEENTKENILPSTDSKTNNQNSSDSKELKENSQNETQKEKGICNDDNIGFTNWLKDYQKKNPYSLVKNNYQETVEYGEYASYTFGYGYWYNSVPTIYNGEDCTRQIYMVMLYIPKGMCDDENGNENPQFYIPATEKSNLVDIITYLKNAGYNCGNKRWR